ncbi:MAG TPA: site-2 protease family protein [Candidatus Saccharimonadales bacterium]|nr:site-2 protease family protein [Candidatus Saccharimonadales bacterium]
MSLLFILIALVVSITLHEFMHAWMSHYLGDVTAHRQGRLTLNPLAHIDPFMTVLLPLILIMAHSPVIFGAAKPVPFNPWAVRYGKWGAALVALAGPMTNFFLAVFFSLWLRFFNPSQLAVNFLVTIIVVNVGFFVFNLIPFPPLDGSRVLYAVAPLGLRQVMDRIERSGIVVVMVVLFLIFPLIGPIIAKVSSAILQGLVPGLTGLST